MGFVSCNMIGYAMNMVHRTAETNAVQYCYFNITLIDITIYISKGHVFLCLLRTIRIVTCSNSVSALVPLI